MNAIVVIGASAGGVEPLKGIVASLPGTCSASIFVVEHIGDHQSNLPILLALAGSLPATFATDGLIDAGHIYVAPPDHHMLLQVSHIRLSRSAKIHFTRPAIDPLFVSAADAYGGRVLGIVLSGTGADGAAGLRAIWESGGTALVQDPNEAAEPSMPRAALQKVPAAVCLPIRELARFIAVFSARQGSPSAEFYR